MEEVPAGSSVPPEFSRTGIPNRTGLSPAVFLYLFVLFHLAAGRISYPFFGHIIKIGENPENLLPLLILARTLLRKRTAAPLRETVTSFLPGSYLIFAGLVSAWWVHPSGEAAEEILRLLGQLFVGVLLAEWAVFSPPREQRAGCAVFGLGMLWLFWQTPWADLDVPDLNGPFPHRNIESAFCLLSWPLLAYLATGKSRPSIFSLSIVGSFILALVGGVFIFLSQSRSGFIGIIVFAVLVCGILVTRSTVSEKLKKVLLIGTALLFVIGSAFFASRFRSIRQELDDPYHSSRAGIWAAAVEGWVNPMHWLYGVGMGDAFDRILVDNPTGNLNYHYRRAHYPHSLYFEWIYWGGIASLVGWFLLFKPIVQSLRSKTVPGLLSVFIACLTGYGISELFESALRDPRVSSLFFLDLTVFGVLRCGSEEKTCLNSKVMPEVCSVNRLGSVILLSLAILPLVWSFRFPAGLILSILSIGFLMVPTIRFPNAGPFAVLASLFFLSAYLPLFSLVSDSVWPRILLIGASAGGLILLSRSERNGEGHFPDTWAYLCSAFTLAILAGVVIAGFLLSPVDLSVTLIPFGGFLTAVTLALCWLFLVRLTSSFCVPIHFMKITLSVGAILVLILGVRMLNLDRNVRSMEMASKAQVQDRVTLSQRDEILEGWVCEAEELGCRLFEDHIRKRILRAPEVAADINRWVSIAKGLSNTEDLQSEVSYRFRSFLAWGGSLFPQERLNSGTDPIVGLVVPGSCSAVLAVTQHGRLLMWGAGKERSVFHLNASSGRFVHATQDRDGRVLCLESSGRIQAVEILHDHSKGFQFSDSEVCPEIPSASGIVRRLAMGPGEFNPWVLDLYGNLYHWEREKGWVVDKRFVSVCRRGSIEVDVARDIAINDDDEVALLACDGEVWTSRLESNEIRGPVRNEHYFPDFAVAQSIRPHKNGWTIVDRYGGVYQEPYPSGEELRKFRGTYLFPRSLPIREKHFEEGDWVVDHVYFPEKRWIYLVTRGGHLLTNHRWSGVWAY